MSIYNKYKANLVLDWDLTKGSLSDQSASGFDATVGGTPYFDYSEKGRIMSFNGTTDYLKTGDVALMTAQTTVSIWVKISETASGYLFVGRSGDPYFSGYISGTGLQIQCLTGSPYDLKFTYTFADNTWHHLVMIRNGDDRANLKIYMDGIARTGVATGNIGVGIGINALFSNGTTTHLKGKTTGMKVWNTLIPAEDVAKLYEEESTSMPYNLTDVKSVGNYVNILPDGNMEDTGTDTYASFNSATVTKETDSPHSGGKYLKISYNGVASPGARVNDQVQVGKTYRFTGWAKSDGTWTPQINDFSGVFWEGTTSTDWQRFDVIKEWTNAGLDFILYHSGQTSGYTAWDDINIFECEPDGTPKYMKAYIADGKGWNESVANVTSGQIENTGFTLQSGFWKVNDEDGFNKNLTCVSNGLATRPSNQVYGTWEFDFKRTTDTDVDYIGFISDRIGATVEPIGYHLLVTDYGAIQDTVALRRSTGVGATLLFVGEEDIITSGAWYKFRITRTTLGEFSIYMKGPADSDYVLLTATGGSNPVTDNTYTTCAHINLDLDTGNIRNFRFIPYIE
jgi:hypothetical protein